MRHLITTIILFSISLSSTAQLEKYKAIFIYKFVQNLEWPAEKNSDSYKIGIYGKSELLDELKTLVSDRSVNGKPIEVLKYSINESSSDLCILFITDDYKDAVEALAKTAQGNSTVLIGESPGLAKKGAPLNFVEQGNSLKFELNESRLTECNVKASGSIKSLAILVN